MSEKKIESDEEKKERIGSLLVGTNMTPKDIAKEVGLPIRFVYRHPKWPERKSQKREEKKIVKEPDAQSPSIAFTPTETDLPPGGPPESPLEKEESTEPAPTAEFKVPEIKLRYGSFVGIIDSGFELFTETTKLTKPNPVKLQKLDHALVDFFIAWHLDFGDPRVLASIVLLGTVAEIGVPMFKEVRARQKKGTSTELGIPGTSVEKVLAEKIPVPTPDTSREMGNRIEKVLT